MLANLAGPQQPMTDVTFYGYTPDGERDSVVEVAAGDCDAELLAGKTGYVRRRVGDRVDVWPVRFESTSESSRRHARYRLARKRRIRAQNEWIAAMTRAIVPSVLRDVLALHSPTEDDGCAGCDDGGACDFCASWPCRTVELIARSYGVEPPSH